MEKFIEGLSAGDGWKYPRTPIRISEQLKELVEKFPFLNREVSVTYDRWTGGQSSFYTYGRSWKIKFKEELSDEEEKIIFNHCFNTSYRGMPGDFYYHDGNKLLYITNYQ